MEYLVVWLYTFIDIGCQGASCVICALFFGILKNRNTLLISKEFLTFQPGQITCVSYRPTSVKYSDTLLYHAQEFVCQKTNTKNSDNCWGSKRPKFCHSFDFAVSHCGHLEMLVKRCLIFCVRQHMRHYMLAAYRLNFWQALPNISFYGKSSTRSPSSVHFFEIRRSNDFEKSENIRSRDVKAILLTHVPLSKNICSCAQS